MTSAVLISLCFLFAVTMVCLWLWREALTIGYARARTALVRHVEPPADTDGVPLDDQPARVIEDLARRLADNPPPA